MKIIPHTFTLKISVPKVLSVNNYLAPRSKKVGLKRVLFMSLTYEAVLYKDEIYKRLKQEYNDIINCDLDNIKDFFNSNRYSTHVTYYINENRINKTDLTNMKKMCEDTIVKYIRSFGIDYDDKMVFESYEQKLPISNDSEEMIEFKFSKYENRNEVYNES